MHLYFYTCNCLSQNHDTCQKCLNLIRQWFYISTKCQADMWPFILGHSFGLPYIYLNIFFSEITGLFDGVFIRLCRSSRIFRQGGPGQSDKKALTTFFFLVLSLFSEVKWSISNKAIIFQGSRGGPTFSRGVQLFPGVCGGGGSNCLFPIETHITCDFPGGGGGVRTPCPPPPLWICTCRSLDHYGCNTHIW